MITVNKLHLIHAKALVLVKLVSEGEVPILRQCILELAEKDNKYVGNNNEFTKVKKWDWQSSYLMI